MRLSIQLCHRNPASWPGSTMLPVWLAAVIATTGICRASTLSIQPTNPETLELHLPSNPIYYFYLQQSTDLRHFTPFSMVLGDAARTWTLSTEEIPSRFFTLRQISLFAPEDTDGDGIDDLYELRHPILNPLDPTDGDLDPDNNGLTHLQEYRLQYDLGDGKREAISGEVSVFTTRPFSGPTLETISDEVSVFTARPFTGPAMEAISEEVSTFTTRPFTGPTYEAVSDEVSLRKIPPIP